MGIFNRTPKALTLLERHLSATTGGLEIAKSMPEVNQQHFAKATRHDLTAAVEVAITQGYASEALALLDAVDSTQDYVVADLRWSELLGDLRKRAASH